MARTSYIRLGDNLNSGITVLDWRRAL